MLALECLSNPGYVVTDPFQKLTAQADSEKASMGRTHNAGAAALVMHRGQENVKTALSIGLLFSVRSQLVIFNFISLDSLCQRCRLTAGTGRARYRRRHILQKVSRRPQQRLQIHTTERSRPLNLLHSQYRRSPLLCKIRLAPPS